MNKISTQPSLSDFFDDVATPAVESTEEETPELSEALIDALLATTLPPVLHLTPPPAPVETLTQPQEETEEEVQPPISAQAEPVTADAIEVKRLREVIVRMQADLNKSKQDALYWRTLAENEKAAGLTDNLTTYRLALQFYAVLDYYRLDPDGACVIAGDCGERARTALLAVDMAIRQDRRQVG